LHIFLAFALSISNFYALGLNYTTFYARN
jgi:hypothetical protein